MVKIELELVDAEDIMEIDESGETLKTKLPIWLPSCYKAERYLEATTPNTSLFCACHRQKESVMLSDDQLTEQLQTKIGRYIRVRDKYMNLLSLLIKSREFYKAYPPGETGDGLPVIELPKTREGRPFIPTSRGGQSEHIFNLSHQHPYMGIARTDGASVGIDIVAFDEINHRLYNDEIEFVEVFRNNFAEQEWNSIMASKSILKEFYLQWAIKEAYTKALGLGMSCNFNSFRTKLADVEQLWEHLSDVSCHGDGSALRGYVYRAGNPQPSEWWFFFRLLIAADQRIRGCVCICCAGPEDEVDVDTQWLTAEELLRWHEQN